MATHKCGDVEYDTAVPQLDSPALCPKLQRCTRCGLRLTRPFQRFPIGAAIEITSTYTTIKLDGVPDCMRDEIAELLDAIGGLP